MTTSLHFAVTLRSHVVSLTLLLALTGVLGCKPRTSSSDTQQQSPIPQAQLDSTKAALTANRTRRCPVPVLRGTPLPGPADRSQLALLEPSDTEVVSCYRTLRKYFVKVMSELRPTKNERSGLPETEPRRTTRALDFKPGSETKALIERINGACKSLEDRVSRAIRHVDSCSAYLPGRNAFPRQINIFALAAALEIRIRQTAQSNPAKALVDAINFLRLTQDLTRGGVWFIFLAEFQTAPDGIIAHLERLLGEGNRSVSELASRLAEVKALLASEPTMATLIEGACTVLQTELIARRMPGTLRSLVWDKSIWDPGNAFADPFVACGLLRQACTRQSASRCVTNLRGLARNKAHQGIERWVEIFLRFSQRRRFYLRAIQLQLELLQAARVQNKWPTLVEVATLNRGTPGQRLHVRQHRLGFLVSVWPEFGAKRSYAYYLIRRPAKP